MAKAKAEVVESNNDCTKAETLYEIYYWEYGCWEGAGQEDTLKDARRVVNAYHKKDRTHIVKVTLPAI